MTVNYPTCRHCGYQRNAYDKPVHPAICPACGVLYVSRQAPQKCNEHQYEHGVDDKPGVMRLWESLTAQFLTVPYQVDKLTFYGRVLAYIGFFFWGWSFILAGIDWQSIGGSFLHNINLPFHEFGHLLFMPFGRFWHILGGSLLQILLPLLILLAFSIRQKDNFGASIMLWWCGQNFIDISPYIADAQLRSLPLILGLGEDSHDWGNLLTMTGNLQHTQAIASSSFSIGCLIMLVSYIWGAYLLLQQRKKLTESS